MKLETLKKIDEIEPNPYIRALATQAKLHPDEDVTVFDMMCFCVFYLSRVLEGQQLEELKKIIQYVAWLHYYEASERLGIKDEDDAK